MNFRIGQPADFDSLAKLRWDFKSEEGDIATSSREEYISKFIAQLEEQRENWTHFIAQNGEEIVAMVSVCRSPKLLGLDLKGDSIGYLTNTYVIPGRRNQGIGEELMKVAIAWARHANFELLFVWPSDRSRSFYTRAGFRVENDIMELLLT